MSNETDQFLGISTSTNPARASSSTIETGAAPVVTSPDGTGWPGTPGKQRVILTSSVLVHNMAGEQGSGMCLLNADDEVDLGTTKKAGGKKWVGVILRDGRKGFIAGDTPIRRLSPVKLNQGEATILPEPGAAENTGWKVKKGGSFLLLKTVESNGLKWVKVRDTNGREGYVDGKVKIQTVAVKVSNTPQHDMVVGAIWCVGGIVVTAATYSAVSQTGGTYFIAWGAILFGGIQFFKGLFRAGSE